jgi:hypothetical protein
MNTNSAVTRRDALKRVVASSIAVAAAAPVVATEPTAKFPPVETTELIPENDYPFFGWQPEATPLQDEVGT